MRTLIIGMQSSGASWVTFNLAQTKPMISVITLWPKYLPPDYFREYDDLILKCVVNTRHTWQDVADQMAATRIILVTRCIEDIVASLTTKRYGRKCGSVQEKIRIYEDLCRRATALFDGIIAYETFEPVPVRRTLADILYYNCQHDVWCRQNYWRAWNFGNLLDVPEYSHESETSIAAV